VHIDVDIVVVPIKITPATKGKPEIKGGPVRHADSNAYPRGPPVVRRVGWIPPRAIDIKGIIVRHIDNPGICRLDDDCLFFDNNLLFGGGGKVALGIGLGPQLLDHDHDLFLLGQEGVAYVGGLGDPLAHQGQN